MLHPRHQPHDPQLRRVHHIVGRVDGQKAGGDLLQVRRRIVVARRVELMSMSLASLAARRFFS